MAMEAQTGDSNIWRHRQGRRGFCLAPAKRESSEHYAARLCRRRSGNQVRIWQLAFAIMIRAVLLELT